MSSVIIALVTVDLLQACDCVVHLFLSYIKFMTLLIENCLVAVLTIENCNKICTTVVTGAQRKVIHFIFERVVLYCRKMFVWPLEIGLVLSMGCDKQLLY